MQPVIPSPHLMTPLDVSTDSVPAPQRLDFWEAHHAAAVVGLRCSAFSPQGLRAQERNLDLGAVRLADIRGNEHVIERSAPLVRSHPKDSIFMCLLMEGDAFFYQAGHCVQLRAGDAILYQTGLPYLYGFTADMRQLLVDLDADGLVRRHGIERPPAPIKLDARLGAGRAYTNALRNTVSRFLDHPTAADAPRVSQLVEGLVSGLLAGGPDQRPFRESIQVRRVRAESFIEEHLDDPELDAHMVARHLHLSHRHLNRVFEACDCTVTQWIWRARLDRARRCLADPSQNQHAIGEIALQWGFATQAHFARCFRLAYGLTPTAYRAGEHSPQAAMVSEKRNPACRGGVVGSDPSVLGPAP